MKKSVIVFFLSFMVALSVVVLVLRPKAWDPAASPPAALEVKHLVTPDMASGAEAQSGRPAPPLSAADAQGAVFTLEEMVKDGPAVLVFIKDKCPCSASAEPYFAQLARALDGQARFFGVIDGDADIARAWSDLHGTPYPILLDPGLDVVHDYEITSSAYVVLIDKDRRIRKVWPGYSADLLRDMAATTAGLAGSEVPALSLASDAPSEPYAGCPFD